MAQVTNATDGSAASPFSLSVTQAYDANKYLPRLKLYVDGFSSFPLLWGKLSHYMRHTCVWTKVPGEVLVTFSGSYQVILETHAVVLVFRYGKERLSELIVILYLDPETDQTEQFSVRLCGATGRGRRR